VWDDNFEYQQTEQKHEPEEEMNLGPPADASISAVNIKDEPWIEVTRGRSRWPKSIIASSTHPCSFDYHSNINLLEFASANPTISAVNQQNHENRKGWSLIKIQVDSGAIDHVMPPSMAPSIKAHPTAASIAGRGYSAANGTKIANHGEKTLRGITETGAPFSMNIQCADVTRALGSVYRLNQGGNSVVLNGKNSYMLHVKSGIKTPIILEGGKYMLRIWIRDDGAGVSSRATTGTTQRNIKTIAAAAKENPNKVTHENRFAALEALEEDLENQGFRRRDLF
jgi:hypothetical protein